MVYRIHICRICISKVVVGNGDRNSKTNLVFCMVDFALDGHRYKNQVKVFMDQISLTQHLSYRLVILYKLSILWTAGHACMIATLLYLPYYTGWAHTADTQCLFQMCAQKVGMLPCIEPYTTPKSRSKALTAVLGEKVC